MTPRRALSALLLSTLAGCVNARDCRGDIPEDLRADVLRFVIDRALLTDKVMPEPDYAFALGAGGRPYEELDEDRRRRVALYATGYTSCIKERVSR